MAETNGTTLSPPPFREALIYRQPLTLTDTWQRWLYQLYQRPGPVGPQGPPGVANSAYSGNWRWSPTLVAPPNTGTIMVNASPAPAATEVYISRTTDGGTDAANFLRSVQVGTDIYIQEQSDASNWIRYDITGTQTEFSTYFAFPVAALTGQAGGTLTNNAVLTVSFLTEGSTTVAVSGIAPVASPRLLGRYSAGSGPAQEITIGTGLALSAGGELTGTGGGGGIVSDSRARIFMHMGS